LHAANKHISDWQHVSVILYLKVGYFYSFTISKVTCFQTVGVGPVAAHKGILNQYDLPNIKYSKFISVCTYYSTIECLKCIHNLFVTKLIMDLFQ